jgi:AcrR family transcriptional regulator
LALTAESITRTALDILSRYGLGDLSMRRLARELDVQPSALYWHVKDKQSLLILISRSLKAEVDALCPPTADPLAAAMSLREVLLKYRDGAEIVLLGYSIAAVGCHTAGAGGRSSGRRTLPRNPHAHARRRGRRAEPQTLRRRPRRCGREFRSQRVTAAPNLVVAALTCSEIVGPQVDRRGPRFAAHRRIWHTDQALSQS